MSDTDDAPGIAAPIEANASPLPDQIFAGMRQIVGLVSAYALGRGWIQGDTATLIGGVAGIVLPVLYGQMKTRRRAVQLAQVAASPHVPGYVARLKVKG